MNFGIVVITLLVLLMAWANGANDVSKGVATLVGSGSTNARKALLWGSLWTVVGGLAAIIWGAAMIKTFSSGYVSPDFPINLAFVISATAGAATWVMVASRLGWPVSTTHALLGGVVGAALMVAGPAGLQAHAVANKALLPLLASPLIAVVLCAVLLVLGRFVSKRLQSRRDARTGGQMASETQSYSSRRARTLTALHWFSSGTTSFARGLNDVPKIAAFLIMALALTSNNTAAGVPSLWPVAMVAVVMGLGGLWGGYRVLQLLAHRVTPLNSSTGLAANLGTSMLVLLASPLGIPVSTTHVSTGSLLGIRWVDRSKPDHSDALRMILFGWVVTLPIAALIAAITSSVFQLV